MRARRGRRRLRATNDHHQELIRTDERDRRPRGDSGADDAVAQAVGNVRSECRGSAQAEQPLRERGHPGISSRRVQHHH